MNIYNHVRQLAQEITNLTETELESACYALIPIWQIVNAFHKYESARAAFHRAVYDFQTEQPVKPTRKSKDVPVVD